MDKEREEASVDVQSIKAEAEADGATAERAKLAEFKAAFPDDLPYAVNAYESGATVEQAKALYTPPAKTAPKAETATGADATIGASDAEGNAAAEAGEDFMTVARQRAKERNIGITAAMQQISNEQPDLHRRFKVAAEELAHPVRGQLERITD